MISTVHAVITIAVGIWCAVCSPRLIHVVYCAAYITGAEVLWRMTDARVFWETAKYATAGMFLLSMLRARRFTPVSVPILYFALLLPSAALVVDSLSVEEARGHISFNLSGPFALMASACFFSHLALSQEQLGKMLHLAVAPIIGVCTVTLFATLSASQLTFTGDSNFATSGGFGPNQVSSALGMGAYLCFLSAMIDESSKALRCLMFSLMVLLLAQSAMTFSRNGVYLALAGILLAAPYLMRQPRMRANFFLALVVLVGVGNFLVLPRLDAFTGGALTSRLTDLDPSNRDRLLRADLEIWSKHPVFGIGPGQSKSYRKESFGFGGAGHTEYSRLLSEHGTLGAVSALLLLAMGVQKFRRTRNVWPKGLVLSMAGWSYLYMVTNAMRLAAPAFLFGLALAQISLGDDSKRLPARDLGMEALWV